MVRAALIRRRPALQRLLALLMRGRSPPRVGHLRCLGVSHRRRRLRLLLLLLHFDAELGLCGCLLLAMDLVLLRGVLLALASLFMCLSLRTLTATRGYVLQRSRPAVQIKGRISASLEQQDSESELTTWRLGE